MVIKTISKIVSNQKTIFNGLCSPAQIEYTISFIGVSSLIISCITGNSSNTIRDACTDIIPYVIVSAFFIWILNALCKGGARIVSWAVVLAPLILMVTSILVKQDLVVKAPTEKFYDSDDESWDEELPEPFEDEYYDNDEKEMWDNGLEIQEEDFSSLEQLSTSMPNSDPSEMEPPTD
tara:strand:- start:95 stop:628 length:534 start_codon:yes stop_codon:yes gene_type:complete